MDIKNFTKHIKPQIEARKMVNILREILKDVKHQDQDVYEKQRKSMEPLIDKLEDLKEERCNCFNNSKTKSYCNSPTNS